MSEHAPGAVASAIERRRTSLLMDPEQPVDPEVVRRLCELATWAPNHHRTEPWRFAVFTGEGRRRLGDAIAAQLTVDGAKPAKVAKARVKYLRAPAMVLVGVAPDPDERTAAENRDAVAAAVQNLLLAATEAGLASFWSSVATPRAPGLVELCGAEPGTEIVAAVYLGHPTGTATTPPRRPPSITWVD